MVDANYTFRLCPATHHHQLRRPECASLLRCPEKLPSPFPSDSQESADWTSLCLAPIFLDFILSQSSSGKEPAKDPFSPVFKTIWTCLNTRWTSTFRLGTSPKYWYGWVWAGENPALALAWQDGTTLPSHHPRGPWTRLLTLQPPDCALLAN